MTPGTLLLIALPVAGAGAGEAAVDIRADGGRTVVVWPLGGGDHGRLVLRPRPEGAPGLIESLDLAPAREGPWETLLASADVVGRLTVGERQAPAGRPPSMSVWNVFFDNPARRPHETHGLRLEIEGATTSHLQNRGRIAFRGAVLGPFKGEVTFTVHAGSRLVQVELAVSTSEDRRAITHEAGLIADAAPLRRVAWMDTGGQLQGVEVGSLGEREGIAVRHRALIAVAGKGSLACFPPPHQFFFPRDYTDNLKTVWASRPEQGRCAFGVRQPPTGGGGFVPWFNAPPGTRQALSFFLLLARGGAEEALRETLRYTRGDRFEKLPGHITFTSHYHMAVAAAAMDLLKQGRSPLPVPGFVRVFKAMGVDAVHLGEFHGDGHPKDPGPLRLPEMEAMFSECRRLSDGELLLLPGEEINEFLGLGSPGKHPGHWMSFFPRPVLWTQRRAAGEPLAEPHPRHGTLYRVGSREDMVELLRRERGLAWTAHPRIKASSWTPDIFRGEDFFKADFWLGAAWKAMPADLSRERLGERALDLLDDMANWGERKYLPGEVDVFKIDPTHELYGHMNINYLRLDRLPRYEEGWEPILESLRRGRFFVTTGEVLIRKFTVGGKESGETLELPAGGRPEIAVEIDWTFPMRFAEVVSGDGTRVHRERIDLGGTGAFESRALTLRPDLRGRKYARFEAWDIAHNGAYTQPVWIAAEGK